MNYKPQPQAEEFHKADKTAWLDVITGDRASGKTYAAAGKVCDRLMKGPPGVSVLVVGRNREWSFEFLGETIRSILTEPLRAISRMGEPVLSFGSDRRIYFVGPNDTRLPQCRFDCVWIDQATPSVEMQCAMKEHAESFIWTSDDFSGQKLNGPVRLWFFRQVGLHAYLIGQPRDVVEAWYPRHPILDVLHPRKPE